MQTIRHFKKSVKYSHNPQELYDIYVKTLIDLHQHNTKLYQKESLIQPLQSKRVVSQEHLWMEVKNYISTDLSAMKMLKKYFIAKARAKYQELKRQALKDNVPFKMVLKKVITHLTPAYQRKNKRNSKRNKGEESSSLLAG
jgi:hypothetical protein